MDEASVQVAPEHRDDPEEPNVEDPGRADCEADAADAAVEAGTSAENQEDRPSSPRDPAAEREQEAGEADVDDAGRTEDSVSNKEGAGARERQKPQQQQEQGDELGEMPRTIVRRIVKAKLASALGKKRTREGDVADKDREKEREDEGGRDVQVSRDALLAFAESSKIFVHYITALAHDWSQQFKRQTILAEDVLRALEDAQFYDFIPELQGMLQDLRAAKKAKRGSKASASGAEPAAEQRQEGSSGEREAQIPEEAHEA